MFTNRLALVCALTLASPLVAGTPPEGFTESIVVPAGGVSGVLSPTAVAYEPGTGNLWIVEKGGTVRRHVAGSGGATTALTLGCINSPGERGGLGIAFDPDYLDSPGSRWVYVYYTRVVAPSGGCAIEGVAAGVRNQVSRFLESNGTLSAEQLILAGPPLSSATNHNGGAIRFGDDGTLYVAMGDNDTDSLANPASRDLSDLRGKLLRVHADGSIPQDNPFVGQAGVREEIWAWGLRNPFRFSIDPATDTPFIADVGEGTWEAIYAGVSGADYGYPCVEGSAPFKACNPAPDPGSIVDPIYVYGHGSQTLPVSGNSITGGPVYRGTAFPAEFQGRYFFGDYGANWIRSALVTSGPGLDDVQDFIPDATNVVDMVVSPAGCLTWVSLSAGVRDVCFDAPDRDADGDGFTPADGDCDDTMASIFPNAPEICDGADNDCNGSDDDGQCADFDFDGNEMVNVVELAWLGASFGECINDGPPNPWWLPVDYDHNGCIDGDDLAVLCAAFGCKPEEPFCD